VLEKKLVEAVPDKPDEPKRQYAHLDHFLAHVTRFRFLLRKERQDHKKKAEILAHEAKKYVEEKQRRNKVKTAEEIEQEKRAAAIACYRTVVRDMGKMWLAARAEVDTMRQKEYEEQQQAKMKGHLARVLDRTDQMLSRVTEQDDSVMNSETDLSSNEITDAESEDSEQMSESDTDSESEQETGDLDANMTVEELKQKYGNLPELPVANNEAEATPAPEDDKKDLGQTDEDSDPETEMDSEFDTDGSDEDDEEDDEAEESEADDAPDGLVSLFSKKEIAEMAPTPKEEDASAQDELDEPSPPLIEELDGDEMEDVQPSAQVEGVEQSTGEDLAGVPEPEAAGSDAAPESASVDVPTNRQSSEDMGSHEPSAHTSPHTTATKVSEPESVSSIDAHAESTLAVTPLESKPSTIKTPVPSLLRGTLREYQHEGLDWLADLYANGRSGILADEMGLGKTIQSIALLAHLAEVYEVWGPHLIVVPTSVMLNWEMEFKKFLPGFKILTYYGTLEERKQKRRGWMADDSFNVCITSYQLVLQDANSFKRRRWHYMILDEAHNIKNFRSERWQTMMTFNTRARLLLTGTPLQNNLTELWSLLFFLHYGQENEGEDDAFAGLKEWSEWFKRPVESILEHGRQVLDEEDREQVAKLHKVIRPFLLRRLKADVEKQMPLKYEHVELCRLSKRQRQLYDGFMSRAQTKETLASGNYLSIINALMQLRKVCNHPDLFETRPINTSFAMPKSVAAEFEVKDFLLRRRLALDAADNLDLDFLQLAPVSDESISMIELLETTKFHAYRQLKDLRDAQCRRIVRDADWHGETRAGVLGSLENVGRKARIQELDRTMYYEAYRHHRHPIYGRGLLKKLTLKSITSAELSRLSCGQQLTTRPRWDRGKPAPLLDLVHSVKTRSEQMEPFVQEFACITPAVVATDLLSTTAAVTEADAAVIRTSPTTWDHDPFHQARMKLSIAFPDKRLLQYDCGKLQRLDKLLRRLQAGGHRALIFTQMTKVLDILEQFLNIHGHRYLRLDGATKVEQRQILTDRFNNDPRILAFILSSRSGGLGINLTGADTVIFYDLDWNPAMDKQCTDRAHRIGQTRDVHIYRFVSEHTIESNILRKASQKQMLDDVVIQEGDFTTDYVNKLSYRDMLDDETTNPQNDAAGLAMDRVLGTDRPNLAVLEQAEDQEDRAAAKVAAREVQHADDGDFEDKTASATPRTNDAQTPAAGPFAATETALHDAAPHDIDDYMVRLQSYLMRDVPLGPGKDKRKKGKKRRDEHRIRRVR
jgi:helicase SWR1